MPPLLMYTRAPLPFNARRVLSYTTWIVSFFRESMTLIQLHVNRAYLLCFASKTNSDELSERKRKKAQYLSHKLHGPADLNCEM